VIPVLLGTLIERVVNRMRRGPSRRMAWLVWLPLGIIWFIFLPNTCYLLTEWRHFLFDEPYHLMREMARAQHDRMLLVARYGFLFLLYSGFGMLCFALAVRPIDRLVRTAVSRSGIFAVPFYFLVSLGVYMGLNLRLNSWDVVRRPVRVLHVAQHALTSPLIMKTIIVFGGLLWIAYLLIDVWFTGLEARMKHRR
jgi:uncharacterized membrane protein